MRRKEDDINEGMQLLLSLTSFLFCCDDGEGTEKDGVMSVCNNEGTFFIYIKLN